jgi:hypothetical protein
METQPKRRDTPSARLVQFQHHRNPDRLINEESVLAAAKIVDDTRPWSEASR